MTLPYQDESLSFEERAKDLVSRMTLEERASQTVYNAPAIPRLGVKAYNWWNEALHGVARAGTATVFPQAIGLAATFDEELIERVADLISTEGRAKFNLQQEQKDYGIYKGLTFWSPNINIFRDPRWGRGHETYGEDPYLTSRMGIRFIKGLQGDGAYLKSAACVKHFAVHSGPESGRHEFNVEVGQKDLHETYLPAFKACVQEASVEAVMGAYNRLNGEPCCGSKTLLQDILRDEWQFKGHVVSDCGAIADFHMFHHITKTAPESAALAITNGLDMNCGHMYLHLLIALKDGLITEDHITKAAERVMTARMRLGLFDASEKVSYNQIPYSVVDSREHRELNAETSRKGIVLLENKDSILPLSKEKIRSIGVIGPNADSRSALVGNYEGTASQYMTVLAGIQEYAGDEITVRYSIGCHLYKDRVMAEPDDRLSEAIGIAKLSDIVICCVGLDPALEGEDGDQHNDFASGDKMTLNLPGRQADLISRLVAVGKPIILISLSGSAITFGEGAADVKAILQAFYPGAQGGRAIASILFGDACPEGKLPLTFYHGVEELPDFTDYSMANRTYRYMTNEALYPFGYGLSYTTFAYSALKMEKENSDVVALQVDVTNTGQKEGRETVQVYIRANTKDAPNHSLKKFTKVGLAPSETKTVCFVLTKEDFSLYNDDGQLFLPDCEFDVFVGGSQPDSRSIVLTGVAPLKKTVRF